MAMNTWAVEILSYHTHMDSMLTWLYILYNNFKLVIFIYVIIYFYKPTIFVQFELLEEKKIYNLNIKYHLRIKIFQ